MIKKPDTEQYNDLQDSQNQAEQFEGDSQGLIHAEAAEQMLLGMLMLDDETWDRINSPLEAKDFSNAQNRHIYDAALALYNKNSSIDPITVIEELKLRGKLAEAGGKEYISELTANATSGENINIYSSLIHDRALRRKFIQLTKTMSANAESSRHANIQEVLQEAEQKIFDLGDKSEKAPNIIKVGQAINEVMAEIDFYFNNPNQITGQSTGFAVLDSKTSGLQKSDFIVLAGRPSMGKTSFALNIAASAVISDNKAALIFSMEMPTSMLVMRFISILGSVNLARVRDGRLTESDWLKIRQAGEMLDSAEIYIDDSLDLTPMLIRSRIRRVKRMLPVEVDLGLVVVDYIQLMKMMHTNENRTNEISEISRSLKGIAKEFNVPVLALSQLNRAVEGRDNKRPAMSDLRDSGAIEQDADVILFIYRDEVYYKDKPESKGIAEIIIGKQRNGPTGMVKLSFKAENASFGNLEHSNYDDVDVGQGVSDDDMDYPSQQLS